MYSNVIIKEIHRNYRFFIFVAEIKNQEYAPTPADGGKICKNVSPAFFLASYIFFIIFPLQGVGTAFFFFFFTYSCKNTNQNKKHHYSLQSNKTFLYFCDKKKKKKKEKRKERIGKYNEFP